MNEGFFKNSFFLFFLSILFSSAHYLICRKLVFVTYKLRSIRVCVCTIHVLSIARVLFFSLQRLTLTRHSQPSCLTNILTTNTHTHAMYIFRYFTLNYCWSFGVVGCIKHLVRVSWVLNERAVALRVRTHLISKHFEKIKWREQKRLQSWFEIAVDFVVTFFFSFPLDRVFYS